MDDQAKAVLWLEEEFEWEWNRHGVCTSIYDDTVLQFTVAGRKMQGKFMELKDDMDFTPPMYNEYCPNCMTELPNFGYPCPRCGFIHGPDYTD